MSKILITGIVGFAGSHLADLLLQDTTTELVGLMHPSHEVTHPVDSSRVKIYREDILNENAIRRVIREASPDAVYHLAGMAHVHESWKSRKETIQVNFFGTFQLLEACRELATFPRTLLIGSGECYGLVPESEQPIHESRPLVPSSPYAVSKIAQEMLGIQYAQNDKYPVFVCRSFNHTGPRQKETFVCSRFAREIALAELRGGSFELKVGNLDAMRDFSDVRDVVRAYQTILSSGKPGDPYNVCSGQAVSIREVLEILISFSSVKPNVMIDREKFRPIDIPRLQGSPAKLENDTNWKRRYDLKTTLNDLLQYWRAELKRSVLSS
jgi:GDP-4-dehydro-6-deoxy-D-mannose reductase